VNLALLNLEDKMGMGRDQVDLWHYCNVIFISSNRHRHRSELDAAAAAANEIDRISDVRSSGDRKTGTILVAMAANSRSAEL
jgi:hypothetical protein